MRTRSQGGTNKNKAETLVEYAQLLEEVRAFKARAGRLPAESRGPERQQEKVWAMKFWRLKQRLSASKAYGNASLRKEFRAFGCACDMELLAKVQEFKGKTGCLPAETRDSNRHDEAQLANNLRMLKRKVKTQGRQASVAVRKLLRDLDAKTPDRPQFDDDL